MTSEVSHCKSETARKPRPIASDLRSQTSKAAKPLASISLDLDNKWSYMKTHGDSGWESFPSYLDIFLPRVLDALDDLNLRITFFIVGQDAALEQNREYLALITERGHEVGNHSFHHNLWLHLLPPGDIERDISDAEAQIHSVTGQLPVGFRGPGFSWSSDLLNVLKDHGYLFDASTLPTSLAPLARLYYFRTSPLSREEREKHKLLSGGLKDGLRPLKPYRWRLSNGSDLLELPVTTVPGLKTPFHLSYLLFLFRYSPILMHIYLGLALTLCRLTRTQPSFLLHPLDFLGGDQISELPFFPAMHLTTKRKIQIFQTVCRQLRKTHKLVTMNTHAHSVLTNPHIPYLSSTVS